jgi:outer membrane protein W
MKRAVLILLICLPFISSATNYPPIKKMYVEEVPTYHPQGTIQLGMRTTTSLFNHDGGPGFGVGGQFRIWVAKKVNTEWFADYITTDLSGLGKREDVHIGWSVMFYPFEGKLQSRFNPYIIAGHCFDYTKVTPFNTVTELNTNDFQERWSSATQMGLGVHWNITSKFNLSLSTQYMIHLGTNIHTHIDEHAGVKELHIEEHTGFSMEGHLLTTLSLNVRLGDLW